MELGNPAGTQEQSHLRNRLCGFGFYALTSPYRPKSAIPRDARRQGFTARHLSAAKVRFLSARAGIGARRGLVLLRNSLADGRLVVSARCEPVFLSPASMRASTTPSIRSTLNKTTVT